MIRTAAVLVLLALNGCAYYNGMYNANRLAGRAEKAERDGRTFDASSYWGQVIVKADSVLARHSDSKWADDARLLRGKALARLDRCEAAVPELEQVQQELVEPELLEVARLELGRCRLTQGDAAAARIALTPLESSADPARRAQARSLLGQASVALGAHEDALNFLQGANDSVARGNRLVALGGSGRLDDARVLADSLIAAQAPGMPWGAFLRQLGKADPRGASAYLERVRSFTTDQQALSRWLLEDAERLMAVDRDSGLKRLLEAEQAGPGTEAGIAARRQRVAMVLSDVGTLEDLSAAMVQLQGRGDEDVALMTEPGGVLATAALVRSTADSASRRPPRGDLLLFLAGELARDSLGAPRLAANLLRRVAADWPQSPYAPKALLAVMALDRQGSEAVRLDLETRYGGTPYVVVAQGFTDSSYVALEDSLGSFAASWRAAARTARAAASPDRPALPRPTRPTPVGADPAAPRPAGRPRTLGAPEP